MPLILTKFCRDKGIRMIDLAKGCAPSIQGSRLSVYNTGQVSPNLKVLEQLVMSARGILSDLRITMDDIVTVPGGLPKASTLPSVAPPEPITASREIQPGESLKDVIRAYVGESGEKLVPTMVLMAQGLHVNADGQQITVTPAEKKYAVEWLSKFGELGEDGEIKEMEQHFIIQAEDGSELARIAGEEWDDWLRWKNSLVASASTYADALSVGREASDSNGRKDADSGSDSSPGREGSELSVPDGSAESEAAGSVPPLLP